MTKDEKPEPQRDLRGEVNAMRWELYYFKKDFRENFRHKGCIGLKLQRLWIYFLTLSNVAIWTFLLYFTFTKIL